MESTLNATYVADLDNDVTNTKRGSYLNQALERDFKATEARLGELTKLQGRLEGALSPGTGTAEITDDLFSKYNDEIAGALERERTKLNEFYTLSPKAQAEFELRRELVALDTEKAQTVRFGDNDDGKIKEQEIKIGETSYKIDAGGTVTIRQGEAAPPLEGDELNKAKQELKTQYGLDMDGDGKITTTKAELDQKILLTKQVLFSESRVLQQNLDQLDFNELGKVKSYGTLPERTQIRVNLALENLNGRLKLEGIRTSSLPMIETGGPASPKDRNLQAIKNFAETLELSPQQKRTLTRDVPYQALLNAKTDGLTRATAGDLSTKPASFEFKSLEFKDPNPGRFSRVRSGFSGGSLKQKGFAIGAGIAAVVGAGLMIGARMNMAAIDQAENANLDSYYGLAGSSSKQRRKKARQRFITELIWAECRIAKMNPKLRVDPQLCKKLAGIFSTLKAARGQK